MTDPTVIAVLLYFLIGHVLALASSTFFGWREDLAELNDGYQVLFVVGFVIWFWPICLKAMYIDSAEALGKLLTRNVGGKDD